MFIYNIFMFETIVNPETGKHVSIYSKTGKKILRNYVMYNQNAGANRYCDCTFIDNILKKLSNAELIQLIKILFTDSKPNTRFQNHLCEHGLASGCDIPSCLGPR